MKIYYGVLGASLFFSSLSKTTSKVYQVKDLSPYEQRGFIYCNAMLEGTMTNYLEMKCLPTAFSMYAYVGRYNCNI